MTETRDPMIVAEEVFNWTGPPECYSCDVYGPGCLWHGVPELIAERLRPWRPRGAAS